MMTAHPRIRRQEHPRLVVWMAWRRYLTTVRASDPAVYEVVEESAWQRLCRELEAAGPQDRARQQGLTASRAAGGLAAQPFSREEPR
jgi:hypothetical protein